MDSVDLIKNGSVIGFVGLIVAMTIDKPVFRAVGMILTVVGFGMAGLGGKIMYKKIKDKELQKQKVSYYEGEWDLPQGER